MDAGPGIMLGVTGGGGGIRPYLEGFDVDAGGVKFVGGEKESGAIDE